MAFFDFDFIENFFFISLGITFALIILLVYHFKQRISSMERKGDTMYELITNVVKELQIMKKINAYYETLFKQSALETLFQKTELFDENNSLIATLNDVPLNNSNVSTNNIVLNLTETKTPESRPEIQSSAIQGFSGDGLPSKENVTSSNSRIVVSDDESSVSDEDSESDETDLNYSTSDDESETDNEEPFVEPKLTYNAIINEYADVHHSENTSPDVITFEDKSSSVIPRTPTLLRSSGVLTNTDHIVRKPLEQSISELDSLDVLELTDEDLSAGVIPTTPNNQEQPPSVPTEVNHLMEMIQKAFSTEIGAQEPHTFPPYYEDETPQPNTYKPVVMNDPAEQIHNVSEIEVLDSVEHNVEICMEQPPKNEPEILELDINGLEDVSNHQEELRQTLQFTFCEDKTPSVVTPVIPQIPVEDKKQTREVYRKMNITQLRGIAVAAGISVDITKMKKNELIQLLENLEE